MNDLALLGGRLVDPASGRDGAYDVAVTGGRIAAVAPHGTPLDARDRLEVAGRLVVPGLVDLHTHLFTGVSHYGIDPDPHCLARGVTTAVDAGSSGAQTFEGFRRYVIEPSRTRVLAFLNIAVQGMISRRVGELEDLRWASPEETVARAREHLDAVVGVKVRLGYQMVGDDPGPALDLARKAAEDLSLPLMCHVIDMRRPIGWLLSQLGPGDVVTHCFHGNPGGLIGEDSRVEAAAVRARARGVLFDVGHGEGSFAYRVARAAMRDDFPPDTISSDLHAHNVKGPVFDEATTIAKLVHCGLGLNEAIAAATSAPAAALGKSSELGRVAAGKVADLTVLELHTNHQGRLPDGAGEEELVETLLVPHLVVRAGVVVPMPPPAAGPRAPSGKEPA